MDVRRRWADRAWQAYLVVALGAIALYYALSGSTAQDLYDVLAVGAGVAVLAGIALHRPPRATPWLLLAAAQFALAAGDIAWDALAGEAGAPAAPSLADVLYLASYPIAAAGLVLLVRGRGFRIGWREAADGAILVLALLTVAGSAMVAPILADPALTATERAIALAYPAGDALLIAVLIPLLTAQGRMTRSAALLAASLAATIAADAWFAIAGTDPVVEQATNGIYLVAYALWGAAALHPSMVSPPVAASRPTRLGRARLGGFLLALAAPAVVIALGAGFGERPEAILVAASFVAIAALVFARLADLVAESQRVEELNRTVVERSADAIFLVEGDPPVVREANEAASVLLGRPHDDLVGMRISELLPAGDVPAQRERMAAMRTTGQPVRVELSMVRGDGSTVDVEMSQRATHDGRIVGVAHDVTETRALEAQLRQALKMEAVGQLAGGIAHDFNNLLTVIRGFASLAASDLSDAEVDARADLEEVIRASDRATRLTGQMLAFSRRQPLVPRVVDPFEVVQATLPMLRPLVGESIAVVVRGAPGSVVRVDPDALEQAILNLAANARDAMPGGGTLTITTDVVEPDAIRALGRAEMSVVAHVRVSVGDTGQGMDAETAARAFEPFFTTKEPGKGTGMGLASVYGLVKQSGGSVYIDTAPGRGSRVDIYLPVVHSVPVSPPPPVEAGRPRPPGAATIVLAEDEPEVRALAIRVLEGGGHRVLAAANGAEALGVAAGHDGHIALVVTDVAMPVMGGRELVRRLRDSRPGITVLYVSGYAQRDPDGSARSSLDGPLLAKPFTADALLDAVHAALEASQERAGPDHRVPRR